MKKIILCAALLLAGCDEQAPVKPPDFEVVKLLEIAGCPIYRFHDARRYHYLTTCAGSVSTVMIPGQEAIQTVQP